MVIQRRREPRSQQRSDDPSADHLPPFWSTDEIDGREIARQQCVSAVHSVQRLCSAIDRDASHSTTRSRRGAFSPLRRTSLPTRSSLCGLHHSQPTRWYFGFIHKNSHG